MKITLTGSLGNINRHLARELINNGYEVKIISSNPERQKDIEALGATAAIGTIEDLAFLSAAFQGADIVYCMEPPVNFFELGLDLYETVSRMGYLFSKAIRETGVRRVVHLSSIGAHTNEHNGILAFHYQVEQILGELPAEVNITFLRPVGFYYNVLSQIPLIKAQGLMAASYGGPKKMPWVSPIDIASAIVEEMALPMEGRKVRYLASEEISCDEIAAILGAAIGKPDLKWIVISDEQQEKALLSIGMNPDIVGGLVEMNASILSGELYEDYYKHQPVLGKVKMSDYASEFAAIYHASSIK
jgi:uncharacterized protein YbjT (DUF2867 family)